MESIDKAVQALRCAVLASLILGFPQASSADNCSGYIAEVNRSYEQSLELAKTNVMSSFTSYDIVTSDDQPNANGQLGECHGTWLVAANGEANGRGYCAFKDKDGDTEYVQWDASPRGGTWKDMGGTGKWAGKSNSGWTRLIARDGKRTLLQWGGTCEK